MSAAGGTAVAALDITQERNTPMARPSDDSTAGPGDGITPPVEPAAAAPATPPEAKTDDAQSAVAEANDVAPDTIKVRLTITPDIETELLGGEAERLDLERQGLIVANDTEGSR